MDNDSILNEISVLIRSHYAIIHIETIDDSRAERIIKQLADTYSIPFFIWSSSKGLYNIEIEEMIYGTENIMMAFAHILASKLEAFYLFKGLKPYIQDMNVISKIVGISEKLSKDRSALILTGREVEFDDSLKYHVASVKLPLPVKEDYLKLLKSVYNDLSDKMNIKVKMTKEDLQKLINNLSGLTLFEAKKVLTMIIVEDGLLSREDIQRVIEVKKKLIEREGLLEYYSVEERFQDIADLAGLKAWLNKRKHFITNPEKAKGAGLSFPKGILLLGVPGTGKSLCAKAVSMEWGLPLLRMDPARLYSKYIGETESKFKRAMETSEKMSPLILWIDEIEKAFASGGEADGGVSQRVLGSFLSWMQDRKGDVFVVATANDVTKLPPELLRKGRFDEIFFVDLPDKESREAIFRIHLSRRNLKPDMLDLKSLADISDGFSGAEIEQVIVSALYSAFSGDENLTQEHLCKEIKNTLPLSKTRSENIDALRFWAKERTISAN